MALEDKADQPRKLQGDEGTVEEHNLKDQVEFDRYVRAGEIQVPPYGMRIARLIPNGTISPGRNNSTERY